MTLFDFLRRKWNAFAAKKLLQIATGSALITLLELVIGITFNKRKNIWNYSSQLLNYKGQICPKFSLLWGLLSLPAVALCRVVCREKSSG